MSRHCTSSNSVPGTTSSRSSSSCSNEGDWGFQRLSRTFCSSARASGRTVMTRHRLPFRRMQHTMPVEVVMKFHRVAPSMSPGTPQLTDTSASMNWKGKVLPSNGIPSSFLTLLAAPSHAIRNFPLTVVGSRMSGRPPPVTGVPWAQCSISSSVRSYGCMVTDTPSCGCLPTLMSWIQKGLLILSMPMMCSMSMSSKSFCGRATGWRY
mmetsp:Transcript_30262/g.87943  ORF Transcript_30262/g.87943 Transcript_30262/m.87943 type:complete len:208 (+) Transcript_30262:2115-2738(+)